MTNQLNAETDPWRTRLESIAEHFEEQASITRLLAQAESPADALAASYDLAVARAYLDAMRTGGADPSAPPMPTSQLFHRLATSLNEKLHAVGELLNASERDRLHAVAGRILRSLALAERDVVDALLSLVPHPPEVIALWIQLHLKSLEARFGS